MAVDLLRPVLVAAAAVLTATAIAHADSSDDQFLGSLSRDGLNVGPPDQAIAIAHQRCRANGLSQRSNYFHWRFGGGVSPFMTELTNIVNELHSQGLSTPQAEQFLQDAITAYCPGDEGD
jgi:hypothetical protein